MANGYESNVATGRPPSLATFGTQVLAGALSHTLTATFIELIASTSFAANRIRITIHTTSAGATNTNALLNLYTGAALSEAAWISGLMAGWAGKANEMVRVYDFPISLASGTRISAKSQALVALQSLYVFIELWEEGESFGTAVESLGVDTTNSRGTSVTPGTTSEGTATSIGTNSNAWNYVIVQVQGNADTTLSDGTQAMDICVGDTPLSNCSDFYQANNATIEADTIFTPGRNCSIAASQALQLRGQSAGSDVEAKYYALYGIYGTVSPAKQSGNMSGGMQ